jgi:hypothetical protein
MITHKPLLLIGLVTALLVGAARADTPMMNRNDGLRETIVTFGDEKVYTILKQSVAVHGNTAVAWVYVHNTKNLIANANTLREEDVPLDDATKNDVWISLAFLMGLDEQQNRKVSEKPTDKQFAGVLAFSVAAERDTPETQMLVEVYLPNRTVRIKQIGAIPTHNEFVSPPPGTPMIAVAACITSEARALGLMTKDQ